MTGVFAEPMALCAVSAEQRARGTMKNTQPEDGKMVDYELIDALGESLEIKKVDGKRYAGRWVVGLIYGHEFSVLVFPEHAEYPDYELGESRISKLWLKRLSDGETVFNWGRGMDVEAADKTAQAIDDFLCSGLAEYIFAF